MRGLTWLLEAVLRIEIFMGNEEPPPHVADSLPELQRGDPPESPSDMQEVFVGEDVIVRVVGFV
jgi:hypothetical protein